MSGFSGAIPQIPRSYIAGLTLSTAGSSATFGIAAGSATDSTNAAVMSLASAYTKTTSAWAVGSGNGSLDTSTIANSTWYHVYLIQRPDTGVVDVLISTSASAPTMPTNYTLKRRVGSMKTNGSAQWVKFIQTGGDFIWDTPVAVTGANPATNQGTAAVTRTLETPLGVKNKALMMVLATTTNASVDSPGSILLSDLAGSDVAASPNAFSFAAYLNAANVFQLGGTATVMTDTSSQVRTRWQISAAGTAVYLTTIGWTDQRGQND